MNERIQELERQATDYYSNGQERIFDRQKFAELIVRECAKFLDENSGYADPANAWHPEPEDLLKHFGVEE
jgi:hypothetical protein